MTANRWLLAVVVLLLSAIVPGRVEATTYDQAMASCQAALPYWQTQATANGTTNVNCHSWDSNAAYEPARQPAWDISVFWTGNNGVVYPQQSWAYVSNGCMSGTHLPSGTVVNFYKASGAMCTVPVAGGASCEVALNLGGPDSGTESMTGSLCATGTPTKQASTAPPSETSNADGSKTYCEPISGKCVTTNIPAPTAPAASSSSANNSTASTTKTDTPASSSSSTTTTTSSSTTTGDGSGSGSGNSTGTGSSVSSTTTDNPASSSSAATKCTTGACDVGQADGNVGQMYQASTDTPASVYADFVSSVQSSPLISATTGFFTVNASGSCPTWHIPGNKYWGEAGFDFAFFCSDGMLALLALASYLIAATAAFCAYRIALY